MFFNKRDLYFLLDLRKRVNKQEKNNKFNEFFRRTEIV